MGQSPAEYYQSHKQDYRRRERQRRERIYVQYRELKSKPCTDCGVVYPHYVMQFDHIGDDKISDVGSMVTRRPWSEVLAEIAKCELVCANCHAERTWSRNQLRLGPVPEKPPKSCKVCGGTENLVKGRRFCVACYNVKQKLVMQTRRA